MTSKKKPLRQDWPPDLEGPESFKRWLHMTPCPDLPLGDHMAAWRDLYELTLFPAKFASLEGFLGSLEGYAPTGTVESVAVEAWELFVKWRRRTRKAELQANRRMLRAAGVLPPTRRELQRMGVIPDDPPTREDYKRVGMIPPDFADLKKDWFPK